MKTDKEWEERARELFRQVCGNGWTVTNIHAADLALQLGREMRAETAEIMSREAQRAEREAADARAEDIARLCMVGTPHGDVAGYTEYGQGHVHGRQEAASIARSTITKPEDASAAQKAVASLRSSEAAFFGEAAIRADEREKIAKRMRNLLWSEPTINGILFPPKPKTREQVLEEALRKMPCKYGDATCLAPECPRGIANRALERKP